MKYYHKGQGETCSVFKINFIVSFVFQSLDLSFTRDSLNSSSHHKSAELSLITPPNLFNMDLLIIQKMQTPPSAPSDSELCNQRTLYGLQTTICWSERSYLYRNTSEGAFQVLPL